MTTIPFLKSLTDEELWKSTLKEAETERNSTLKVIAYLQEINLRHLHLKRGYPSLHEFCVSVLKYSDGGAYRRIKAMKLIEELPETKKSIEAGTLNLTTASQLQQVIESKKKSNAPLAQSEKLDLFHQVEGKSKREVEKTMAVICPEVAVRIERQRQIDGDKVQKTLIFSNRLNEKIERLKKLRCHENKDFVTILEEYVDHDLKRLDPMVKSSNKQTASPGEAHSRYVSARVKSEVWKRSKGECTYVDLLTKKKCNSTNWLEIDHIIPFAKGGPTVVENLRLLCSNHNKLEALNHFGEKRNCKPTMK